MKQRQMAFKVQKSGDPKKRSLRAIGLGFRRGNGPWLFREVTLEIRPGEIVGLTGPSGCGKTTLGRLLAGYDHPSEGKVLLGNEIISHTDDAGYHPVQMVFQHPERAVNPRWRLRRIVSEGWQPDASFLHMLGIETDWLDRWPNELSGGELQRICIARALGPETRFLIADEMTAMLDAITQAQIWHNVLHIVRERQIGVLVISHDVHLLHRLCDRMLNGLF